MNYFICHEDDFPNTTDLCMEILFTGICIRKKAARFIKTDTRIKEKGHRAKKEFIRILFKSLQAALTLHIYVFIQRYLL